MADTKGISVQVPVDLHTRVKAEQEQLELTMSQYIEQVLEEHFTPKLDERGGNNMNGNTRTLAFQVSEELFQRVKDYLSKHRHLTQRNFVIGLIETELNQFEETEARIAQRLDTRDGVPPEEDGDGEIHEEGGDGEAHEEYGDGEAHEEDGDGEPHEEDGDGEPHEEDGDGEPQEGDGEPQEGDRPTGEE